MPLPDGPKKKLKLLEDDCLDGGCFDFPNRVWGVRRMPLSPTAKGEDHWQEHGRCADSWEKSSRGIFLNDKLVLRAVRSRRLKLEICYTKDAKGPSHAAGASTASQTHRQAGMADTWVSE